MSICSQHSMQLAGYQFWTLPGMEMGLSEIPGCKVDLLEEGRLKPRVQKNVEAEALRASWQPFAAIPGHSRQHRPH
jgi:hypothetical protein